MIQSVSDFFLQTVGEEWCVFFCAMLPIIELRGAIPLGIGLELPLWKTYLLSVLGNMVPVPFVLLFVQKLLILMEKSHVGVFRKFALFLKNKAEKNQMKIEKFSFWGVCLFVAVPLPVTGAWTGSLVASSIHMKFYKAFLSALFGVMIAGVIVSLIASGIFGFLSWIL